MTGKGTCWIYNHMYIYTKMNKKNHSEFWTGVSKNVGSSQKQQWAQGVKHIHSHTHKVTWQECFKLNVLGGEGTAGYITIFFWGGNVGGRECYGFSGQLLPQILLRNVAFMASWQAGRQLQLGLALLKPFSVASPTFANWSQFHGSTCNGIHSVVSCSQSPVRL